MIIQDDTGTVDGANAYITVAFFRAYWISRGEDLSEKTDDEIEAWIVQATSYIDIRFKYKGTPLTGRDQTTEFPREYLYDRKGYLVEGIPREVEEACAEYTKEVIAGSLTTEPTTTTTGNVIETRSKVGPIEKAIKYSEGTSAGSASTFKVYQTADRLLGLSGFTENIHIPIRG